MQKVYLKTWGCQANIADSEQIAGILKSKNFKIVNSIKDSDIVIANTCSVKNKTQSKILDYLKKVPKNKKLFVGGCLTKSLDVKKKVKNVTAVFGTNSILKLPGLINGNKDDLSDVKERRILIPKIRKDKDTAIIVVEQGCTSKCSFCATKLARGNLKSYRIGDIKREFEKSVGEGCKKIYLTGQDLGCYGFDIKANLPELLNELVTVKGNYKIRVGMMNPWHAIKILPELIKSYKSDKIMKFLHIPVQSGSEEVLKNMKRLHTVKTFKKIVNAFRSSFQDITIATDIIVGYPTETEKDFKQTLSLIREIKPQVMNISMFSSRQGTEAFKLKQLSSQVIKERSKELTKLYKEIKNK